MRAEVAALLEVLRVEDTYMPSSDDISEVAPKPQSTVTAKGCQAFIDNSSELLFTHFRHT